PRTGLAASARPGQRRRAGHGIASVSTERDPWDRSQRPGTVALVLVEPTPSSAASSTAGFAASGFADIDAFLRVPRITTVAAGPDDRVVAAVGQADEHGSQVVSSLWELDPDGAPARRLTFSEKGESAPRFAPDGSLLFSSARPDPQGDVEEDVSAIWRLPGRGEASVVAWAPGGLTILATTDDGTILAATSVLPGSSLDDDAERRKTRTDAKQSTI